MKAALHIHPSSPHRVKREAMTDISLYGQLASPETRAEAPRDRPPARFAVLSVYFPSLPDDDLDHSLHTSMLHMFNLFETEGVQELHLSPFVTGLWSF